MNRSLVSSLSFFWNSLWSLWFESMTLQLVFCFSPKFPDTRSCRSASPVWSIRRVYSGSAQRNCWFFLIQSETLQHVWAHLISTLDVVDVIRVKSMWKWDLSCGTESSVTVWRCSFKQDSTCRHATHQNSRHSCPATPCFTLTQFNRFTQGAAEHRHCGSVSLQSDADVTLKGPVVLFCSSAGTTRCLQA